MSHEINAVNIYSIDEERLRFRVIIAIDAANQDGRGQYNIDIPIPTSFTNSHEYSTCRIKCDSFTAWTPAARVAPSWGSGANFVKLGAMELQLSAPSAQTTTSFINAAGGGTESSGFRQILPWAVTNVGNAAVATAQPGGYAWLSISGRAEEPILAANPFGQRMEVRFINPTTRARVYLSNTGALPIADEGLYVMQLDVTMVANK